MSGPGPAAPAAPAEPAEPATPAERQVDVLIVGGGLAGLALARQLLLREGGPRVLLADRRALPPRRQKVGEATVQVSGYYFSRVLEMEEHLLRSHFLKYNLRFYWPSAAGEAGAAGAGARGAGAPGRGRADRYEELSQSYIRNISNIATYQLDRNLFEAELLRVNLRSDRFELCAPAEDLQVTLAEAEDGEGGEGGEGEGGGEHTFRFRHAGREIAGRAAWVVDASGRGRFLARRRRLAAKSPIRHGATFCWVDGLVDLERMTDLAAPAVRKRRDRAALGHFPAFLATNHLCGEGYWFWTIPLHGKTSLGLVYDRNLVPRDEVATAEKMIAWICREYPLLARDLPGRRILEWSGFADFAHDSSRTLSAARWALCGEACRFSDPLYSPGGDLISIYNTLIADAIATPDRAQLASKVRLYEELARSLYEAYLPSYAVSYEVLGDQETFTLRYAWELTVYFAFFVFPFINDLFTDRQFVPTFLRRFARLGPINRNLHAFLVAFHRWKKDQPEASPPAPRPAPHEPARAAAPATAQAAPQRPPQPAAFGAQPPAPVLFDFYEFGHLRAAEACFYRVGLTAEEARPVLAEQLENLEELARFILAHGIAVMTGEPRALSAPFVAALDLRRPPLDLAAMADLLAAVAAVDPAPAPHRWRLATPCMARFRPAAPAPAAARLDPGLAAPLPSVRA